MIVFLVQLAIVQADADAKEAATGKEHGHQNGTDLDSKKGGDGAMSPKNGTAVESNNGTDVDPKKGGNATMASKNEMPSEESHVDGDRESGKSSGLGNEHDQFHRPLT